MADPISATGLALAIVPLLISAFENYEITFQPFVTYCRYVKEVERFRARLEPQRAIFLNECELLFMAVSDDTSFAEVLRDPNHPSRHDEDVSRRLEGLLGTSYNTCVSTLNLINDTLNKITLETKGFKYLLEDKETRKAEGKSSWSHFRQKIKISFSKTRLNDIVDELRFYNEDLVTLSRQIRELAAQRLVQKPTHKASSKIIDHFQVVQKASTRLHDILATKWSCDERTEHIASMSLEVEDEARCHNKASQVRFSLVLTCMPQNPASRPNPLWLKIESMPSEHGAPQIEGTGTAADPAALLQAKLRSVRFEIPPTSSIRPRAIKSNVIPRNIADFTEPALDLCAIGRLCQYFQRRQRMSAVTEPCVGFLEKTKTFKHFVYPSPSPQGPSNVKRKCLKDILQEDFEQRQQEAWIEKLKLARILTLAVLQFQATPWLSESWSSDDISFYSANEMSQSDTPLTSPYLNVRLSHDTSSRIKHPNSSNASSISPNPTLFSLGVVLIELGYDAPLQALRHEDDLRGGASNQFTDFFTATRLSKLVSKRLNLRYGRLVQKCLACNFGVGTELESAELQSAIVVNVVNELDACLKDFGGFYERLPLSGYPV